MGERPQQLGRCVECGAYKVCIEMHNGDFRPPTDDLRCSCGSTDFDPVGSGGD